MNIRFPEGTVLDPAAVDTERLNHELRSASPEGYSKVWNVLSALAAKASEEGNFEAARALWVLADACSMMLKPSRNADPFDPLMVIDGRRSAVLDDISEEDAEYLRCLLPSIEDLKVRARIADILWTVESPKDVDNALLAIDAYRSIPLSAESWIRDGAECWERALVLARILKSNAADRLGEIEATLVAALISASDADGFLPAWISELLARYRLAAGEALEIGSKLYELGSARLLSDDLHGGRSMLEGAAEWFSRSGDAERACETKVKIAESWAREATLRISADGESGYLVASMFVENAIQAYRQLPRVYRERLDLEQRIAELRELLNEYGARSIDEMRVVSSDPIDITGIIEASVAAVSGKTAIESLRQLCGMYHGAKKAKLEAYSKEMMAKFPLQSLFQSTHFSSDGRVIAKRPGIDQSEGQNAELITTESVKHHLMEVGLVVQGSIIPALSQIRLEHRFREWDMVQLARESPLVPPGRESIIGRGLLAGLELDFLVAIHLLTPQLEHIVRHHLREAGETTTTLDARGIQTESGLSTLLDKPAAEKAFGEDLVFELRALFCVPYGPNIRNELAHGLVDPESMSSLNAIYAWWLLLRLIFNTYWGALLRAKAEGVPESGEANRGDAQQAP